MAGLRTKPKLPDFFEIRKNPFAGSAKNYHNFAAKT